MEGRIQKPANGKNPLILFVDLDEWFHCRWATGSPSSRWASVGECFRETYHSDRPAGEILEPTRWLLDCFREHRVKVTFAVLGEVAEWYPDLIKQIAREGHNFASHGMHHVDATLLTPGQFSEDLARARHTLEDLSGKPVVGFRAPNLIITDWLPKVLIDQGFAYDSSVCPARNPRKFKAHFRAPHTPYRVSRNSLDRRGSSPLVEIPMAVFPLLSTAGGTSISTRILGWSYTKISIDNALRSGPACYYMHPYEFNPSHGLSNVRLNERLFLLRTGRYMKGSLQKMLRRYEGRIVTAEDFVSHRFPVKGSDPHA